MLLLLARDTEVNPGPRIKYPCLVCEKPTNWGQHCLQCDECDGWFHTNCMGMPLDTYQSYTQSNVTWFCSYCGQPNNINLPSIFDISLNLLSNSFSQLEDTLPSDEELGASSPTETNKPSRRVPPVQRNHKLKAIVVNCDGLYNKIPLLETIIQEWKPDMIVGSRNIKMFSWLLRVTLT